VPLRCGNGRPAVGKAVGVERQQRRIFISNRRRGAIRHHFIVSAAPAAFDAEVFRDATADQAM
jgi:hypothetical protein